MNIFVCSKLSLPDRNRYIPNWSEGSTSHQLIVGESPQEVKSGTAVGAIIGMGVGCMEQTYKATARWPNALLFCYNWDTYEWVWENPRPGEYDYHRYGKLLQQAKEVWVPSECTKLRTYQWWKTPSRVILSSCPIWDWENPIDNGYVLCSLREIPDKQWNWFERACEELELPYKMSNHECSLDEYKKLVANCRFIVSHLYEASTGGLTLLEAYYLGKPCLVSGSKWHGGIDYLGDRARYFSGYESLKLHLLDMFDSPLVLSADASRWVMDHFSEQRMINQMMERVNAYT